MHFIYACNEHIFQKINFVLKKHFQKMVCFYKKVFTLIEIQVKSFLVGEARN